MSLTLGMITTDSVDPLPLAHWWADRLGGQIIQENDGWFVIVSTPIGILAFQKIDDPTPGKNRIHLDLGTDTDLETTVWAFLDAGASLVGERNEQGFRWFTLADPQGNQFCIAQQG